MSEAVQGKASSSRVKAFFFVVLVFAALGPAVGGLAFGSVAGVIVTRANSGGADILTLIYRYVAFVAFSMLFSYFLGIAHALIAGVVVAAAGIWKQWNNILVALAAGIIASVTGTVALHFRQLELVDTTGILWFMPSSLAAALACWYLTRSTIRATWNSAEPAG